MKKKTLIVIGGGAAGFFCAVNAARLSPGLRVILLEKSGKLLSKVKISGGGRCNVTHHGSSMADMIKKYPRGGPFLKKAFPLFFIPDTVEWFRERKVALKTERDGRMFPVTDDSQTIINCLLDEAARYSVEIKLNSEVRSVEKIKDHFIISTDHDKHYEADYVCLATGGYPKSSQWEWVQNTGHHIDPPVPSLFTFNIPDHPMHALMGISVEHARVKIAGTKLNEEGPLLITHWGLSGPAVLKLSAWGARELAQRKYHFKIHVNWLPACNEQTLKINMQALRFQLATQKIINRNPFHLPQRLWEYFLSASQVNENLRWADLPAREQNKLIQLLTNHPFDVSGKTTFKEEFVTCGGIRLLEVDAQTMQSRLLPGLFFAGEVLDIDGITGGYNFQNAWTTGWIAAAAIAKLAK